MDPQQRKTLEVAYMALSQGLGVTKAQCDRTPRNVGCFIGISCYDWMNVPHPPDAAGCGGAPTVIANRVNFALNLKGASITCDTACSAGLTATHSARVYLLHRAGDPLEGCISGGVNMALSAGTFIGCCSGNMLSWKGRCFTFDKGGDGYARGEGASTIFIQITPYEKGMLALCAGSQANQDGKSATITAPNGPAQERCIKAAFREASIKPVEVDCFECHGTGTALGDPIEVGSLVRCYKGDERSTALCLTSNKSNMGHLEGGAGMAGFLKCCLQVGHAESSPNLHLKELNAHLDMAGFPGQFLTEGVGLSFDASFCGVSSFGFGGTNAHAIAYGKNSITSRGLSTGKTRAVMLEKLKQAAAPDVFQVDEDEEDWATDGMPLESPSTPCLYQLELGRDGKVHCREIVEEIAAIGDSVSLIGSFSNWQDKVPLTPSSAIPNLYVAQVTIGGSGSESFQVISHMPALEEGEEEQEIFFFPETQGPCSSRAARIKFSSDKPARDRCWMIKSKSGAKFQVEFYIDSTANTINWIAEKDGLA